MRSANESLTDCADAEPPTKVLAPITKMLQNLSKYSPFACHKSSIGIINLRKLAESSAPAPAKFLREDILRNQYVTGRSDLSEIKNEPLAANPPATGQA